MPPSPLVLWSSVKGRILLLVVVSIAAAIVGGVFALSRDLDHRMDQAYERAGRLLAEGIQQQNSLISDARGLLDLLAILDPMREASPDRPGVCPTLLRQISGARPWVMALAVLMPDGTVACTSGERREPPSLADREYVRRALADRSFALSGFVRHPRSGKPMVVAIRPILDKDRVVRLVAVGLDPSIAFSPGAEDELEGARVVVIDRDGRFLAMLPEPATEKRGTSAYDQPTFARMLADFGGQFEERSEDGRRWLWNYRRFGEGWTLGVALPMTDILAAWWAALGVGAAGVAAVALLRFLVLSWFLNVSVLKWLKLLRSALDRVARGERPTRSSRRQMPIEIAEVMNALDSMARRIAENERALIAAREAADHANALKSDFLATVSHETRAPMNGLIGFADLLLDTPLVAEQRTYVQNIRDAGRYLLTIMNDVLDYSRMEAGHHDLREAPFRIEELVAGCLSLMKPVADAKELSLDATITEAARGFVTGDPDRIRQILLNLIGNAIKFTDRGGVSLTVETVAVGEHQGRRFAVTDTGIGIPAERHRELFRRFTKLVPDRPGTGLGLAICRQLVIAMKGDIGFRSRPGEGSTFWFAVPLPPAAAPSAAATDTAEHAPRLAPVPVLLVEDVEMNRDIAVAFLRKGGHQVTVAENGAVALRKASESPFGLILMDVMMPELDGIAATRAIRMLPPPFGLVPILAMTASVARPELERCLQAGMNGWISKPIDRAHLLEEVDRWAARPADRTESCLASLGGALGPNGLANLLDVFINEFGEHLSQADIIDDLIALRQNTHTMVSLAGNLGFDDFAACARALTMAARENDRVAVRILAPRLARAGAHVMAVIRQERARLATKGEIIDGEILA